ncbi:MAG: DNA ligase D [Planctomycetota bacterium]|nr:DNA ligase D [Planctomycetota bacterium]
MPLDEYKKKRDFARTPEPGAEAPADASGRLFVVQKHDASRLHYDFRLQVGDVLASWAVPKGPSLNPVHKRLAVHVEDHPLEYGDFEGIIPAGQYGGGTVMLWDRGEWTPEEADPARAIRRGKLSFSLEGRKLHGRWTLTRLRASRDDERGDNWLLIKHQDEHASDDGESLLKEKDRSIKSGRTLREIAAAADATWTAGGAVENHRDEKAPGEEAARVAAAEAAIAQGVPADPSHVKGAAASPMPRQIRPQLCTLTDRAPPEDGWLYEIKFDGYRLIARRSGSSVHLLTRSGADWTDKFRPLSEAVGDLPVRSAIFDGEATIVDAGGRTAFQELQSAIKARHFDGLVYFVFDLLYLDGFDLTQTPLVERKRLLRQIVPETGRGMIRFSDHVTGNGADVHKNACQLALEGIICKKADAPYVQMRSRSWLKVKCGRRQEFVVIGWTPPGGARKHFGALLLGAYDADGQLAYTGRVGTGFDESTLRDIRQRLDRLAVEKCPADVPPDRAESRGVRWVKPELVAEVEFTQWTDEGRLRHPSFQGLREDKPAGQVRIEKPRPLESIKGGAQAAPVELAPSQPEEQAVTSASAPSSDVPHRTSGDAAGDRPARGKPARGKSGGALVAGIRISHPERVLYPETGVTKLELARYYEMVGERMLPFVAGRPLSTVRCPAGRGGQCFFQKHVRETFGEPVTSIRVEEEDGPADYIAIDSAQGLVALVQFGVLEIHPWGSSGRDLERPDQITIDLDPAPDVPFARVKQGAELVRRLLEAAGLRPFLKTTGGKGLHVVAPLKPRASWDEAKAFCLEVARTLVNAEPDRYIATATKSKRLGKIFVDYLRNGRGATSIAPYSSRARANGTVAVPLAWDELKELEKPDVWTVRTLGERLARGAIDPWSSYEESRRELPLLRDPDASPPPRTDRSTKSRPSKAAAKPAARGGEERSGPPASKAKAPTKAPVRRGASKAAAKSAIAPSTGKKRGQSKAAGTRGGGRKSR